MKVDIFMPFYVGDYLKDTMHLTYDEHGAYVLLLLHYWARGEALPDDDEYLRHVPKVELQVWLKLKLKLSSFFEIRGNKWFHHRVEKELQLARQRSAAYKIRANKGVLARQQRRVEPVVQPQVQHQVEPQVIPDVNPRLTTSHSHSHSSIEEREKTLPEIPPMSRKEFDALAETRGVPKDCAEWFWNTHDSRNWLDATGQPIIKVEPLLLNTLARWRSRPQPQQERPQATASTAAGAVPMLPTGELILRQKEYDRVIDEIARVRRCAATDAMGSYHFTEAEKRQLKELRARRDELKRLLGVKV